MIRPGFLWSAAAATAAVTCVTISTVTATVAAELVLLFGVLGLALFLVGLLIGLTAAIGFASVFVLSSALFEAMAVDEPVWVRSLVIGCLWFASIELGWEAIDRRNGYEATPAVGARRLQEVLTVIGVTLVVGVVAVAMQSFAPARTMSLQVLVVAGFVAAFVTVARRLTTTYGEPAGD